MSPRRPRRGIAAVEFALWLPLLVLLLSAIVDLSWYMSRKRAVVRASHDGARTGAAIYEHPVLDEPGSRAVPAAQEQAEQVLDALGVSCPDGVVARYRDGNGIDLIRVEVECPFTPLFGMIPMRSRLESAFMMASEFQ